MTENDRKLATRLAAIAYGRPVMVVGSSGGLGSDQMALAITEAKERGVEIVILEDAPPPQKDFVLTLSEHLPESLTMPAPYRPEREWWRGINPRRQRKA